MVGFDDRGPGDDEDVPAWLERGRHHPERLADPAPDTVPDHGSSEPFAGREPEPGLGEIGPDETPDEQWVRPGDASLRQPGELARAGEHDEPQRVVTAPAGQAERCFRPLLRRLASTRRPPAVFMRARKPCSFARWRFLG